jgi:hypothetical protein
VSDDGSGWTLAKPWAAGESARIGLPEYVSPMLSRRLVEDFPWLMATVNPRRPFALRRPDKSEFVLMNDWSCESGSARLGMERSAPAWHAM